MKVSKPTRELLHSMRALLSAGDSGAHASVRIILDRNITDITDRLTRATQEPVSGFVGWANARRSRTLRMLHLQTDLEALQALQTELLRDSPGTSNQQLTPGPETSQTRAT